jgi:hypothetical protein
MNALKCWLLIVGMLLSLSATPGINSTVPHADTNYSIELTSSVTDNLTKWVVRTKEQKNKPLFVKETVRATTHQTVLFLANSQANPAFELEFEFNSPDLSAGRYYTSTIDTTPWFLKSSQGSTRVSGWKDGNSLYTATITYHS